MIVTGKLGEFRQLRKMTLKRGLFLFFLFLNQNVFALNFAVDNTGAGFFCIDHSASGGNFTTLAAAMGAANVGGGPHTIDVCPGAGAYTAQAGALNNVNYAGLTIQGTTGIAANVTVNPSGGAEIFDIRQTGITIQHLTAVSGNANDGIEIRAANATISNVDIQNTGRNGILIINATGVTISNVTIATTVREGILANAGSTGLTINSADATKPQTAVSFTTRECIEIDGADVNINDISVANCSNMGIRLDGANAKLDNAVVNTTTLQGIYLDGLAPLLNQDDPVNNTITINNAGREGIRSTNNADDALIDNLTIDTTTSECAEHQGDGDGVTVNFENYDLSNCGLEGLWMRSPDQLADDIKVDTNAANRECMEVDGANSIVSNLNLDNCSGIGLRIDAAAARANVIDINTSGAVGLRFDGAGVSVTAADIINSNGIGLLVSGNDGVVNGVNISNVNNTGIRIENARADLDNIDVNNTRIHGVQITQHDADINTLTLTNIGTYLAGNVNADAITITNRRLNLTNVTINDAPDFGIHYNTTNTNTNAAVSFNNITITNTGDDGIFVNRSANNMVMDDIDISNSGSIGLSLFRSRRAQLSNLVIDNSTGDGIQINRSRQNEIFDSTISNNGNRGIALLTNNNNTTDEARNNLIHDNIFIGNANFGLRILQNGTADNDNNRVYENCFFTSSGVNARDDETTGPLPSNLFDVGSRGNFWGTDSGGAGFSETCVDIAPADGICDAAFPIPAAGNSTDNFPLTSCSNLVFHHFNVTVSTTASTCTSTEVTIEAVDASDIRVPFYNGIATLNTENGFGNWSELDHTSTLSATNPAFNTVSDTPDDDDGAAAYQFAGPADGGIIGLFLRNEHEEDITVSAEDTLVGTSFGTSGNVNFADNVFEITPNTCTGSSCIGPTGSLEVVAGRNHSFHVQMLRRDSGPSAECGVATTYNNVSQDLKAWIVRTGNDPSGVLPTMLEQTASLGNNAAPAGDNLQLDFNSTPGEADFTLTTTDVGDFEIFIRDDSNAFAEVNIDGSTGAADPVTVRPFGIALSDFDDDGTLPASNPNGSAPGDGVFVSAGTSFFATVGAYLYSAADDDGSGGGTAADGIADGSNIISDNGLTPAFAWDTSFTVNKNSPLAVASVTGTLNNSTVALAEYAGTGMVQISDLQYMEVGSITLDPLVTNYLTLGIDFTIANGLARRSEVVGRFDADHFEFSVDTAPSLSAACSVVLPKTSFTYVDQPFDFVSPPQLTARAYANGVTFPAATLQNYHDFGGVENFWRLDLSTDISLTYSSSGEPGPEVTLDSAAADYLPTSGSGTNGVIQFTLDGPFSYTDRDAAPFGPVAAFSPDVSLDFSVSDADGANGTQLFNPISFANPEQRWGRLAIGDNFGSELLALGLPLQSEYYDGTSFIVNVDDDCSAIAATDLSLTSEIAVGTDSVDITNAAVCLGTGLATATLTNNPLDSGLGDLSFSIASPAEACAGYAETSVDLSNASGVDLEWLYFDWDEDGVHDNDPEGRASFGLFNGPREFIYSREPWN
ncbi:MAG: hypothetical protein GKR93_16935 [Gammaproteobacteria bacterium]|nr:hypothetical protein [Gammaproteobacteria bacterium]